MAHARPHDYDRCDELHPASDLGQHRRLRQTTDPAVVPGSLGHISSLVRHEGPLFDATLDEPRVKSSASFSRLFSWLAICLFSTLSGLILLLLAAGHKEEDEELKEIKGETWVRAKTSGKEIIDQVKPVLEDAGKDTISVLQS